MAKPKIRNAYALKMSDVGAAVRKCRRAQGETMQSIAEFVGISRRTIIKLEAGEDVRFSTLTAVMGALGMELDFSEHTKKTLKLIDEGRSDADCEEWF